MADLSAYIAMGKDMGLEGQDLLKFVSEREQREEAKAQRLSEEAKAQRLSEEAKNQRLSEEAKNQRLSEEAKAQRIFEEAKIKEEHIMERERRAHERDLKKMELEALEKARPNDIANTSLVHTNNTGRKGPKLPYFNDAHDSMDSYLERFERLAALNGWDDAEKAIFLSTLLQGKALDAYSRLTADEASDYKQLKDTLLRAYQLTEDGFKRKFYSSSPETNESPTQFSSRMETYFDRWIDLSGIKKEFNELKQLLLKEQFLLNVPRDLVVFIREHKPINMLKVVDLADTFLDARGWRNLAASGRSTHKEQKKSNVSEDKANQVQSNTSSGEVKCFNCHKSGHIRRFCPSLKSKSDYFRKSNSVNTTSSCVTVSDQHVCSVDNCGARLQCGCKIPMVSGGCLKIPLLKLLPTVNGYVDGKAVVLMRDTGCNCVVIRKSLVSNSALTGEQQQFVMIDRTVRSAPVAQINIESPFYSGRINALCLDNPICDVIIGNIVGAKMDVSKGTTTLPATTESERTDKLLKISKDNYDTCKTVCSEPNCVNSDNQLVCEPSDVCTSVSANAAVTRSKAQENKVFKSISVPEAIGDSPSITELINSQTSDRTLKQCHRKCLQNVTSQTKTGLERFAMHKGLMYRYFTSKSDSEKISKQLIVPVSLRTKVMKLGHETIMAGHLGSHKTVCRITQNFYWPGVGADVHRFCMSCDHCQKTFPKGKVIRVPVQKPPLIDTPFRRVAIDIIGPIEPRSGSGNRFILTLIDFASRYPEAVALPSCETERVAEALLGIFSRIGVPTEILSDNGSQFTSNMMQEVCRLMSIKQLFTTPYHAMANGLCEKMNGTLKQMLRRVCLDNPKDWDRYIEPVLFAYRETTQSSTGFSPFELVYGRTMRGPMAILQQLWTKEDITDEIKTTYEYVVELRNRLEESCKLAMQNLATTQYRYKINFDRRSKTRSFEAGSKVLLLLPTKSNKMLLTWRGPFEVVSKIAVNDYRIKIGTKEKVYHANMLKQYVERNEPLEVNMIAAISDHSTDSREFSNGALLEEYPTKGVTYKEVLTWVRIS